MKRILNVVSLSYRAFMEVYKFDKFTVILTVFILVFGSISVYLDIFFTKVIVDSLFSREYQILIYSLVALLLFKFLSAFLQSASSVRNLKLNDAFNNKCDEELIDRIKNFNLNIKEHPKFNGDFSYLRFVKGQTYTLYFYFTQLFMSTLTLIMGLQILFHLNIAFCVTTIAFGVFKGSLALKPVNLKAKINESLQRKSVKYVYFYELIISIKNQKELMIYRTFDYFKQKWRREKEECDSLKVELGKMNSKITLKQDNISTIYNSIIIIMFAFLVTGQQFTIGNYIALTMAVNITVFNFSSIINQYAQMYESYIHFEKHQNSNYYDSYQNNTDGIRDFTFNDNITVSNLSFSYPNTQSQALNGVSLQIKKGETIAILGENGSGKSTLVKFLLGLYRSNYDTVLYDGISVNEFNSKSMYEKCSVVFQDFIQYQTTIRDNIGVGDIDNYGNKERMHQILKNIDIKLKDYDLETKVGLIDENAINLSGGQWQRLALSRFYFKENPELAIFDEPTSALDPMTEVRIFNNILTTCENITTIIISHRVGIAKRADKIIVMEKGEIVEQGNHRQLINMNGRYKEMWLSQKEWYQDQEEVGGRISC